MNADELVRDLFHVECVEGEHDEFLAAGDELVDTGDRVRIRARVAGRVYFPGFTRRAAVDEVAVTLRGHRGWSAFNCVV